ncbi:cytochrome P450 [Martensiomyces pterosporus]|nr:cytochrome P450 [Martensiomyces pterosporus]
MYLSAKYLAIAVAAYVLSVIADTLLCSPVRRIPGDFLARFNKCIFWKNKFQGREAEYILRNYGQYGNIFLVGPRKVALCDPADCRKVLSSHAFQKDRDYSHVTFLEPNLVLTRDAELNKQRRRQVGPTFALCNLRKMEPAIRRCGVEPLIANWAAAIDASEAGVAKVNYYQSYMLASFDVISVLAFGKYYNVLNTGDKVLIRRVEKSMTLLVSEMIFPICKYFPLRWLMRSVYREVDQFIEFGKQVIAQRRKELQVGMEKPADMLQSFIDAEDPTSKIRMTSSQVVSESIVTMIAGTDTTSSTMCWITHLLLLHPVHYGRVQEEVRAAFERDHMITYDEARLQLPFLEACVCEAMRLRPVAGNVARLVPKGGITLQGHFIPEGYSLTVCLGGSHMNKDVWSEPHVFNPERFLENPDLKKQLMTFSSGARICPGRNLAWLEIFITLANLYNRFEFALPEDSLFGPDALADNGQPEIMPRKHTLLSHPRYPERDCNVLISKRK